MNVAALRIGCFVAFLFGFLGAMAGAQVPQLLSYQGRIAVGSVNFNGTGSFKFAIVDPSGSTTYWSNDGTSNAGNEPAAAVSLTVTNGLYSVLLGDLTLPNMTAVPATVFTNPDVRLRVWFNDGTNGSKLLTPDQRVGNVGYAATAAGVSSGALTSAMIAPGAVGAPQLASGGVTGANIAGGAVGSQQFADGAVTNTQLASGAVLANLQATGGNQIEPRIPISSLPFSISSPGSYFLTQNLSGAAGITITSGGVTLDLNGFELAGSGGSGSGVVVSGNGADVCVRNGSVRGWASHGVDVLTAINCAVTDLRCFSNQGDGLRSGPGGLVRGCACQSNAGNGITAGTGANISNCTLALNGGAGIVADTGSTVTGCTVTQSASDGIQVSASCQVSGNTCSTSGAGGAGVHCTGASNRVDGNLSNDNGRGYKVDGIKNLIVRNSARDNTVLDYDIAAGNDYGQVMQSPGAGFSNPNMWANFGGGCGAGFTQCGVACVNLQTDAANCNTCGNACATGFSCVAGACTPVCQAGLTNCSGVCRDLTSDSNHCGTCTTVCAGATHCNASVCN